MTQPLERPRLRPGLAAARDEHDPFAILLFDELRLSRQILRLNAREFTWLQWFDGTHTLRDIQASVPRAPGSELLPLDPLIQLIERLDQALFLHGPRFESLLSGPIREPSCIGCYPADADALGQMLQGLFTEPAGPGLPRDHAADARPLRALLAPHIDYARGNVTYAWAFKEFVERCGAELFVIVGTSHYSAERFTLTRQNFKTPLGLVPTDQPALDRIIREYGEGLFADPVAHLPEHSIELEVVWLQHLLGRHKPFRIVPLLVGSFADCVAAGTSPREQPDIQRMVHALRRMEASAGEPVVYIISGDLAHIGPKFGDPRPLDADQLRLSRERDDAILRAAVTGQSDALFRAIAAEGDARRICGLPPAWLVLETARPAAGRTLHYQQYAHPRGFESVSFAAMAFYG